MAAPCLRNPYFKVSASTSDIGYLAQRVFDTREAAIAAAKTWLEEREKSATLIIREVREVAEVKSKVAYSTTIEINT